MEELYTRPYEKYVKSEPYRANQGNRTCNSCFGIASPVRVGDGTVSYHKCEQCGRIEESKNFMSITESKPLGSSNPYALRSNASLRVIEKRRTPQIQRKRSVINNRHNIRNSRGFVPTTDPVPLLGNKRDFELEDLLSEHNGVLVSVIDDNVDGSDPVYTNYTNEDIE